VAVVALANTRDPAGQTRSVVLAAALGRYPPSPLRDNE
jgi:hypothetical protein